MPATREAAVCAADVSLPIRVIPYPDPRPPDDGVPPLDTHCAPLRAGFRGQEMKIRFTRSRLPGTLLCALAIAGCGGGGGSGGEPAAQESTSPDPEKTFDAQVTGSVGDGPIANATLSVYTSSGELLETFSSDQDAAYNVSFKTKGKYYPLVIEAVDGIDLVTNLSPDFKLESVSTEPRNKATVNLTPYSTLAVAAAREMSGGISDRNIDTAVEAVMSELSYGLTSFSVDGPISTEIDDSNLAEMVKSSEALAELFRRTNQAMLAARGSSSIDAVIAALGSDLVDGDLDGRGGPLTDAQVSATAAIVSAQVLVESMTNRLRVNGEVVTAALDRVINQLASRNMSAPTASLPVTAEMLANAKLGVDAALAIAPSAGLETLRAALDDVSPGMLPADVREVLASDAELELDDSISSITAGTDADVDTVNTVMASDSGDTALTISGTPSTQVLVGEKYAFEPTTSGGDGTLTFSISGKPGWAAFDTSTGLLSGTPGDGDVGTYSDIVITVTDGQASSSLGPFSISVDATATGAAELSWTAPTENTDGTTLTDLDGYSVHWGKDPDSYSSSQELDAGIQSYVVEELTAGTWYFAVRARNSDGLYSDYSNEASKTIE